MTFSPLKALSSTRPVTLIAIITLFKAVMFFALLPAFQATIASYYGIDFADNYQVLGENLAEGNGYRFTYDTAPTLMREAGYPLFLGILFSLFGYGLTAARAANLILGFASALFISKITTRVTKNELAAKIAPLLFMIHPGVIIAELRGGVENLFIALLLCCFLALFRAFDSRKVVDFLLAGIVLGIASNVRGTALLFPSFLLFYFLLFDKPRPGFGYIVSRMAVVSIGALLALTPWMIRNYSLVQKIAPTASVAGVSAHAGQYICTHLTFSNRLIDVDGDAGTERAQLARDQGLKFKDFPGVYYLYFDKLSDEIAFNSFLGKRVVERYEESPSLLISCAMKNAFHFWVSGKSWTSTALNAVIQLPYILLAIAGVVVGLRGRFGAAGTATCGFILVFIIYTIGVYAPILAQARYSIPLIPLLSVLAAAFIALRWSPQATGESIDVAR